MTGGVTTIGAMHFPGSSTAVRMADLAQDSAGNLFGVSVQFNSLYSINPTNAEVSFIGVTGTDLLGLAFDASGTLYGTSFHQLGGLYTVDTSTGAGTFVGPMLLPGGVFSLPIEDIAFDSHGNLYGVGDKGSIVPILVTIDPATGDAMEIGVPSVGNPRLGLGIAFDSDDNLFLAHRAGSFWSIDTSTGRAALVDVTNVLAYGATSNPHPSAQPGPVPEPPTLPLFLVALACAAVASRRRRAA